MLRKPLTLQTAICILYAKPLLWPAHTRAQTDKCDEPLLTLEVQRRCSNAYWAALAVIEEAS